MNLSERLLDLSLRKIIRKGRSLIGLGNPWLQAPAGVSSLIGGEAARELAALPRHSPGVVQFDNVRLQFNDNAALIGMLDEIFVRRNYEFSCDSRRPVIIDCGANIGVGVAYLKTLFPDAIVHAFEPDRDAFGCLESNVASNGFRDVFLHRKAVWVRDETLKFFADGSWGGGLHAKDGATPVMVEAVDLAKYLQERVDFLKMDIEGAETEVIQHVLPLISQNVDRLFFEWHSMKDTPQKLGVLLQAFESAGFRYHIKEASSRMAPFAYLPPGGMDSQLDVFVYRASLLK